MKKEDIYRYNFPYGVLEIVFFVIAINLIDPSTVLPLFITLISGSPIFIGFITTIFNGGTLFPQIFFYKYVERKPNKKSLFIKLALLRSSTWTIMGIIVLLFPSNYQILKYALFFISLTFAFILSIEDITWADLIAKIVHPKKRGSFMGIGSFIGSVLSIIGGFFVKWLLSHKSSFSFPFNFALIFFTASFFFFMSVLFFSFVKVIDDKVSVKDQVFSPVGEVFHILKTNLDFSKFIIVNFLSNAFLMSLPFFLLYGKEMFSIPNKEVGYFVAFQNIGRAVFTYIFGIIGDRIGHKSVIIVSNILAVIIIVISIFGKWFTSFVIPSYLFYVVFLLSGAVLSGKFIGTVNYLLDIAPPGKVPAFRGISNSLISISLLIFPSLGGIILKLTSYPVIFISSLFFLIISTLLSFTLKGNS